MHNDTTYLIPTQKVFIEQEIKKSKFIATVGRAVNRDKAETFIKEVCDKYNDANHNCYAFIAGNPYSNPEIGMGDDGEVSGTAGRPLLSVLQHKNIGEVVAVVSRYFGGIKLGPGGLVRAYTSSLQLALDKLKLEKCVQLISTKIEISYQYENAVRNLLKKFSVSISNSKYNEMVVIDIDIPENISEELNKEIMNKTRGDAKIIN